MNQSKFSVERLDSNKEIFLTAFGIGHSFSCADDTALSEGE